jgi:hypothetical protein
MTIYKLTMTSEEYGTEEFEYDSWEEASEAYDRLNAKVEELDDGIERDFNIEEVDTDA